MFCKNCGNELCEEAYVCPNCGCLVKELPKEEEISVDNQKGGRFELVTLILCMVALALSSVGYWAKFVALAIAIIAFVFGLVQKGERWVKYAAIFVFIVAVSNVLFLFFVY